MLKKLFVVALCLCSFTLYAQEKFGQINTAELFNAMPEKIAAQKTIEELAKKYESELTTINQEYTKKYQDFIAGQDSLPETIKVRRMTEIQEIEQRLQNFKDGAYQDLDKKNQELMAPITEKIRKAIQEVGGEGGFSHIYDSTQPVMLYLSPSKYIDVMPLVKTKLGLN